MQTSIIKWNTIHEFGDLWWQHLQLRKQLFVDSKGWQIPHNSLAEWDQYDNANTIYVITHKEGRAIAASRLNPCNFESAGWSYMIRDAVLGRLPGIPADIADLPPTDPDTWEATRFTVDPTLTSEERNAALSQNATALAAAAREIHAKRLIALMPPAYIRWLSSIGLPTHRLGPTRQDAEGDRICVMEMPIPA